MAGKRKAAGEAGSLDAATAAAVIDTSELIVVVLDRDGRILHANRACQDLAGSGSDELVGRSVWTLVPEEQQAEVEQVFARLRDTGIESHFENEWLTAGGERRQIAWSNLAVCDASGGVERVVGTGIDVTELRALEVESSESEENLSEFVHSAMDAIVSVDESQRIALFNPAAEKMFGRKSADVLGSPIDLLIPERFRAEHREHVKHFADAGSTSRRMGQLGHVWGLRADGEEFPVEASLSRTQAGGRPRLTAILRDLSDRLHAEEVERQLRESEEMASLGTLIAGIAHDIGTPLNVILGYLGMLESSLSTEKDLERLQILRDQVKRVSGLVQTLMNFARPQQPQKAAPIRVEELLERALDLIPETAKRRGISVERDFADTPVIRAHGERLERGFLNLLVNACDAMAAEGGTLRVSTRSREDGVEIRISDTGAGMAPEVVERIFEPFFTTKQRGKGSGLGLFVTRGIVSEQGGTIEVSSETGRGTEFRLLFPVAAPPR